MTALRRSLLKFALALINSSRARRRERVRGILQNYRSRRRGLAFSAPPATNYLRNDHRSGLTVVPIFSKTLIATNKENPSAFTLIELLVVMAIIAVLASFSVPAITSALTKGQLVGTVNNVRQYYLAGYQMALDGTINTDANYNWPGDYTSPAVTTLSAYSSKLVTNSYLKVGDLAKLLSGPGAICTATGSTDATTGVTTVTLGGSNGVKVYRVKDADATNVIFGVSANYTYNTALAPATSPFGDKGFVVMRKGGDALSLRKNNATAASYGGDASKFQSAVGKLSGDADGTLGTEGSSLLLVFP